MFFQSSDKDPSKSIQKPKSTRKKRKKQKQKIKKKKVSLVKQSLANTMSTWAENFTVAATWQLKHQVAMWKSRATALEYENQILRDTLRQFYVNAGTTTNFQTKNTHRNVNNANIQLTEYEQSYMDCEPSVSGIGRQKSDTESSDEVEAEDDESDVELEISDEYMAFLKQNFEFRKARDERKKREAAEEKMKENAVISNPQPSKDRTDEFKELYGDNWQRVAALDSYLLSEFISVCDSEKPGYWPNIPLRF